MPKFFIEDLGNYSFNFNQSHFYNLAQKASQRQSEQAISDLESETQKDSDKGVQIENENSSD